MANVPARDGTVLFGTSAASRFTGAAAEVNALTRASIRPGGIGSHNAARSIFVNDNAITSYFKDSATFNANFTNTYPGFNTSTYAGTGAGGGTGWRGLEVGAQISFPAHRLDQPSVSPYITGYDVSFNGVIYAITDSGGSLGVNSEDLKACVAIMWQDNTGTWRILPHTERDIAGWLEDQQSAGTDGLIRMDAAISTFITPAQTGATQIQAIQPVVAFYNDGGAPALGTYTINVRDYVFSAAPLRVGYP